MTTAMIGYGTTFAISTTLTNPPTNSFVAIAEVLEITPPSDSIDTVDATHMSSPNATREFIMGLRDPGEASFDMAFVPGSATDLTVQGIRTSRQPVHCKITDPNGATWQFVGVLTGYEPTVPLDDRMTATVTFKVSGSTIVGAPTNG